MPQRPGCTSARASEGLRGDREPNCDRTDPGFAWLPGATRPLQPMRPSPPQARPASDCTLCRRLERLNLVMTSLDTGPGPLGNLAPRAGELA